MLWRIGLLLGDEQPLRQALLERFSQHPAARAEMVTIGPSGDNPIGHYDIILDRISPLLPSYRSYLRSAALNGAVVVPDTTRLHSQDKLLALGVAQHLGIDAVRAVQLPQRSYSPHIDPQRALANQQFPFRWDQALAYVGLPAELRACDGLPWQPRPVADEASLMAHYARSGERALMLQQAPLQCPAPTSVRHRCVRLGARCTVLVATAAGWKRCPDSAVAAVLSRHTRALSDALGYLVNAVDFAVSRFEARVIDAHQPLVEVFAGPASPLAQALVEALIEALVLAPGWRAGVQARS